MRKPGIAKIRRVIRADMPAEEKAAFDIVDKIRERLEGRGLLRGVLTNLGHITLEEIAGKNKSKSIVRARHAVWRWMHDDPAGPELSWPEIGVIFNRDHTTIMYAVKSPRAQLADDRVAGMIATWLETASTEDDDTRSFVDLVDRERMAAKIREGAWR